MEADGGLSAPHVLQSAEDNKVHMIYEEAVRVVDSGCGFYGMGCGLVVKFHQVKKRLDSVG